MSDSTSSVATGSEPWTGRVLAGDTTLAVADTGGSGVPIVYLNGQFAGRRYWRRVIAELDGEYRQISYDMRSRGRSGRSKDNSFDALVDDVSTVLDARGVDRALLVGWSYGAVVALHWATKHPDRVLGFVPVDGAYPFDWSQDVSPERVRKTFQRMRFLLPLARPFGMSASMSAEEHAESNIELNELYGQLGPVLDSVSFPVRYVVATGGNLGGSADEMERMRASLQPALARNPHILVSDKVPSNHGTILRKDFKAVADAVRDIALPDASHSG